MSLFLKRHKILCQSNRINSKHFCQKYFSQKSENQIDDKIPKENKQINDEEYSLHYDHDKLINEDEKFIQDIPGPNNDRTESIETQYQNWRIAKKPFEKRLDLIKKARIPSYKMLTDHLEEFAENSRLEDVKFQANHERKYNKEDAEKVLSHKPKPKEFKTRHFKKDFLDKNILSFKENPETYQKATYVSLLKSGIHYGIYSNWKSEF
ncbi:hypothetical protein MHBO_003644 [Bonamia ostreae]|uniref:Uncharacterized protein n=1 Tax=Bonamia ostreae TaxID=126728 RepID=A0ABV2AR50_9EUKA